MVAAEVAMLWQQLEFANRLFKIIGMGENQSHMRLPVPLNVEISSLKNQVR